MDDTRVSGRVSARIFAGLTGLLAILALVAAPPRHATAAAVAGSAGPVDTTAFVLFGWLSPPADSTTEARVAEMADLSFNLMLPAWEDLGRRADNLKRLDWAAAHGMRCIVWDRRLEGAVQWLPTFEDTLDQIAADYRDHPAFYAYYLGDEPRRDLWPLLSRIREAMRPRDPNHPAFNNLLGYANFYHVGAFQNYLWEFIEQMHPPVLCDDHYDFLDTGDREVFVMNAVLTRAIADSAGLAMWNILQLVPHLNYRPLTHGEMRWQVAHQLAYGARGIGYFTYWTPDPDPAHFQPAIIGNDGRRTPWYEFLKHFNTGVRAAGETLARSRWLRTTHAGSLPLGGTAFTPDAWVRGVDGRAAIGEFEGPAGEPLVLVANSDSAASQSVALTLPGPATVRVVASGEGVPVTSFRPLGWDGRVDLLLAPGDFALVTWAPLPATPAPFAMAPNPARDVVRFATQAGPGARLEIVDLAGRVIWAQALGSAGVAEWRGESIRGVRARPGLYFARVRDAGSVRFRRFAWLGVR